MKFLISAITTIVLFSAFAFASETVKGAKKDYEDFKKEMSVKIESAEKKIEELKEKSKSKGSKAQDKIVAELEEAKDALKKQQAELKYESESSWMRIKSGFSEAADKLNSKIQKALK